MSGENEQDAMQRRSAAIETETARVFLRAADSGASLLLCPIVTDFLIPRSVNVSELASLALHRTMKAAGDGRSWDGEVLACMHASTAESWTMEMHRDWVIERRKGELLQME